MRKWLAVVISAIAVTAGGQPATTLVPFFDENVSGANGSKWQSELRLYNSSAAVQTVAVGHIFPYANSVCTGFASIVLQPAALVQLRSIGCGSGAAALEINADTSVVIQVTNTNTGGTVQDACCLSGYSESIPTADAAYKSRWTLANMQIPLSTDLTRHLGRHNLGLINPNDETIVVSLRYFDADGVERIPFYQDTITSVTVPPRALVQVNNVFPLPIIPVQPAVFRGFWRVVAESPNNFYAYDSYVDNTTNDATFISPSK